MSRAGVGRGFSKNFQNGRPRNVNFEPRLRAARAISVYIDGWISRRKMGRPGMARMKGQQLSTGKVTRYASPGLAPLIYSFCVLFRLYSVFFARSFVSLLSLFCMCVCVFSLFCSFPCAGAAALSRYTFCFFAFPSAPRRGGNRSERAAFPLFAPPRNSKVKTSFKSAPRTLPITRFIFGPP